MSSCKGDGEYTNRILRRRSVIEFLNSSVRLGT